MLAYIGDAVYSMYIRQRVVEMSISKVQVLHTLVTEFIVQNLSQSIGSNRINAYRG